MYILLVGFHPFDPDGDATEQAILANMRSGKVSFDHPEWEGVSTQAKGLVKDLLAQSPDARTTAAQLVTHPWILGEDVPSQPLPATHERLQAFIQARRRPDLATLVSSRPLTAHAALSRRGTPSTARY